MRMLLKTCYESSDTQVILSGCDRFVGRGELLDQRILFLKLRRLAEIATADGSAFLERCGVDQPPPHGLSTHAELCWTRDRRGQPCCCVLEREGGKNRCLDTLFSNGSLTGSFRHQVCGRYSSARSSCPRLLEAVACLGRSRGWCRQRLVAIRTSGG